MSLAFDRQEFDARLARVREQMADQNLDVVLVFGQDQMFYLTGYDQIGYSYYQVLVVSRDDPRVVYLCREVDAHIIRETSVAEDIRVWYDDHRNDPTEFTAAIVREFVDITGCRIGMELQTHGLLPVFYARLAAHLAAASIVDASALLTDLRLEKSPAEVACMREAGTLFDIGMRAGFAAMHEGTRECDVHGAVMQSIYAAGGEFPAVAPPLESGPRTAAPARHSQRSASGRSGGRRARCGDGRCRRGDARGISRQRHRPTNPSLRLRHRYRLSAHVD